jgi:hypothetical protein
MEGEGRRGEERTREERKGTYQINSHASRRYD